jgi:Protein of unknown function (DUF2752)
MTTTGLGRSPIVTAENVPVVDQISPTEFRSGAATSVMRTPVSSSPRFYWGRSLTVVAALGVYGSLIWGSVIRCPLATLFHVPCPTCGSTRAVFGLLGLVGWGHRNAARDHEPYNWFAPPLALCAVWFFVGVWYHVLRVGKVNGAERRSWVAPVPRLIIALYAGSCVLWIARFLGYFGGPIPVE